MSPHLAAAYALFAFAGGWSYFFLSGFVWGAGYAPTSERKLRAASSLLSLKEGDTIYDLGSGFGRALLFFTRQGVFAVGVEADPLRRLVTRWSAKRKHLSDRVTVLGGNLFDADLAGASKVFCFLSPLLMRRLRDKVLAEMRPGSLVVSVDHRFPEWEPANSIEGVHLYIVPDRT